LTSSFVLDEAHMFLPTISLFFLVSFFMPLQCLLLLLLSLSFVSDGRPVLLGWCFYPFPLDGEEI